LQRAEAENRPLTWNEQEELFNWYSERVDAYVDRGEGDCWLSRADVAALIAGALRHFEDQRYTLGAWVVMPNHVHVVVRPKPSHALSGILKSWKGIRPFMRTDCSAGKGKHFGKRNRTTIAAGMRRTGRVAAPIP
jgi:hypothetical protein